jgi:copper homeostasis protein
VESFERSPRARAGVCMEVCIDRISSAKAAVAGGADRIEICGALGADGVTPSYALVEQCLELPAVARMAMIRPHEGGFRYSDDDLDTMQRDLIHFRNLGVEGVVFGVLNADHSVDCHACRRLIDAAGPMAITFHRAFDLTPDPLRALDDLIDLGCHRVLTSGHAPTAIEGTEELRRLVEHANGQIKILAGSGIHGANVTELIRQTKVDEVHISGSELESPVKCGEVTFGQRSRITIAGRVRAVREKIDSPMR